MVTVCCPWVGIDSDPEIRHSVPDEDHICYARTPQVEVDLEYQIEFCLTSQFRDCPFYRDPPEPEEHGPARPRGSLEEDLDDIGPLPPGFPSNVALLWALALISVVSVVYIFVFLPRSQPDQTTTPLVEVEATATLTLTATPSPVSPAEGTVAVPSPTFGFLEPTATPTPYPGGALFDLAPEPEAVGWLASDESRGNHFGDSYLYAGVFDSTVYHGAFQLDLSSLPRGARIHAGVLELAGLDDRRLGPSGVWEVRILVPEADEDWNRTTYQDVHNAGVFWTLSPPLGVLDIVVDEIIAFELPRELLDELERRLLDEHYTVSFRLDGPQVGESSLFAWDSGYGPVTQGDGPRLLLNVGPPPMTPIPTGTPVAVVVTSTPTPANVVTAAALARTATAVATTHGLPTPTSLFEWTATPVHIVTNTPTPANRATADYRQAVHTAVAFTTGTYTPTPTYLLTATPTPAFIPLAELPATPTPTPPLPTPAIPASLVGSILFRSDRTDGSTAWLMDSTGGSLALLTAFWPYSVAASREALSPDGTREVVAGRELGIPAVLLRTVGRQDSRPIVAFESGQVSAPVWSPLGYRIAFGATASGASQIWVVSTLGTGLRQLTLDEWGSASHPSFSPDGTRLVYTGTDEEGRRQVWVIGVNGTGRVNLSDNDQDEWDPVWVK